MLRGALLSLFLAGCVPAIRHPARDPVVPLPEPDRGAGEVHSLADRTWRDLFDDPSLVALIDEALQNNQELAILGAEIGVANAEVIARRGEFLPEVGVGGGAGVEKVGEYTSQGASDAIHEIEPGVEFPEPLPDFRVGAEASWEVDVWKKLRNATKAARLRYLSSIEGRNFAVTVLVAEIADAYYELMALDNQLEVVRQNIALLEDSLQTVQMQKEAARTTELGVQRFKAELLKSRSIEYEIRQRIVETENRINFLCGRYPQPIERDATRFAELTPAPIQAGVPTRLLENRPDIRQAELELEAAKLDVKAARAAFYPALRIDAEVGYEAYSLARLAASPESLLYGVSADLLAPILNRKVLKGNYLAADSKQMQAVLKYERTVLNAYIEAANRIAEVENLNQSYAMKAEQVQQLQQAVDTSMDLYRSARAEWLEVLTTRREALEAQMELYETKQRQMSAAVGVYQALGGGWRAYDETHNPQVRK